MARAPFSSFASLFSDDFEGLAFPPLPDELDAFFISLLDLPSNLVVPAVPAVPEAGSVALATGFSCPSFSLPYGVVGASLTRLSFGELFETLESVLFMPPFEAGFFLDLAAFLSLASLAARMRFLQIKQW